MLLKRFTATGLHGYLSPDVHFNPLLTFLTGINGSGKTSVVRSTVALLSPSIPFLTTIQYSSLGLEFTHEDTDYRISATSDEKEITMEVSGVGDRLVLPRLLAEARDPHQRISREHEADFFRELDLRYTPHPVMALLRSLPTPMFLDLERRSPDLARRKLWHPAAEALTHRNVFGATLEEGLGDARDLAQDVYRTTEARLKDLAQALRDNLILTAFRLDEFGAGQQRLELPDTKYKQAIAHREELLIRSLHDLGFSDEAIDRSVKPFFARLHRIVGALPSGKAKLGELLTGKQDDRVMSALADWIALRPKEQQIQRFVELLEKHAADSAAASRPIEQYLDTANRFLGDSGKGLVFVKPGNLRVKLPNGLQRGLSTFSSGERQIVVILTHLAFNPQAGRANILIIDEPELSLHVRWQEMFVDALRGVSPKLQLIMGTHSPSIILDRLDACVDLGSQLS